MTMTDWQPTREVEIIVGTPPGGGQDRPARALMKVLANAGLVTVPMKLSNVVGKGGGAAWDALCTRGGDPHVLSINSGPLLANRILGVSDYDHAAFTPLANLYVPCAVGQWRGIMGGAGISVAQVAFWEQAFAQATTRDEWQAELAANYWTHDFKGAGGARAFLDGEQVFLQRMLRELGVAPKGTQL